MTSAVLCDVAGRTAFEAVSCDLCGSDNATPVLSAEDKNWPIHSGQLGDSPPAQLWTIVRCQDCGLAYLNPRPAHSCIADYYPTTYYAFETATRRRTDGLRWRIKRIVRRNRMLFELARYTPWKGAVNDGIASYVGWVKPGKLLEVGCGAGQALEAFAALGWDAVGLDICEQAVQAARGRGQNVILGQLDEVDLPAASFDVIRMSHVLEHTSSPLQTLKAARRLIGRCGYLYVEVPNFACLTNEIFGDYNWGLDLPRHFYHFTAKTLKSLAERAGFSILKLVTCATPASFVHSIAVTLLRGDIRSDIAISPAQILNDHELRRSLEPFCRRLDELGQGNTLILIAAPAW